MELIENAGLLSHFAEKPVDKRRLALKQIRETLRKQNATDEETEDALDALIELAKE